MICVTDEASGHYSTVIRLGYFDIRNNQGRGNKVIHCFEENNNKQQAHETQTDIENHAFCAQPSNKSVISKQITYEPLVTVTINIVLQTLVTVFLSGMFVLGKFMNPKTILFLC